jgi:hypothetical protein
MGSCKVLCRCQDCRPCLRVLTRGVELQDLYYGTFPRANSVIQGPGLDLQDSLCDVDRHLDSRDSGWLNH